jgi:hypothetical protein
VSLKFCECIDDRKWDKICGIKIHIWWFEIANTKENLGKNRKIKKKKKCQIFASMHKIIYAQIFCHSYDRKWTKFAA